MCFFFCCTAIAPLIELLKRPTDKTAQVDVATATAAQQNAAIGLARLAKHAPHLECIRALRGMEILLAHAQGGKFRGM
jgi:hypothetical protein